MRTPRRLLEACKAIVGQRVVLVRQVTTRGGAVHKVGWIYEVRSTWRGRFSVVRITPGGRPVMKRGIIGWYIRNIERASFDVLPRDRGTSGDRRADAAVGEVVGAGPVRAVAGRSVEGRPTPRAGRPRGARRAGGEP